jgi:plastocyanin
MSNRGFLVPVVAGAFAAAACGEGSAPLDSAANEPASTATLAAIIDVSVRDNFFTPDPVTVPRGSSVLWSFDGNNTHTATDDTGMALYDSGFQGPGDTFSFTFIAGGTYDYRCRVHATMRGTVRVPIRVVPATGGTGTTFTVTWSSATAPAGFVFDTQIRRPGAAGFVNWRVGRTGRSATFVPDAGTGMYRFRSRLRKTGDGTTSEFSQAKAITVS